MTPARTSPRACASSSSRVIATRVLLRRPRGAADHSHPSQGLGPEGGEPSLLLQEHGRQPPALFLIGPTASGKSALALAAAQRWPVEIISVDSALVYRGMDIGTAKPSAAERAAVPHHLIDGIDPTQAYSAAQFVADATRLVADITARGRHALLVGGTMLYFKALADGLDAMPPADATVRAALDARAAAEGWPALHADLAQVDPATAARLPPGDAQRIQRALEVWQLTGRPISAFHGSGRSAGLAVPLLALEPADRAWLHARIAERFDAMLAAGFVDEVRARFGSRGTGARARVLDAWHSVLDPVRWRSGVAPRPAETHLDVAHRAGPGLLLQRFMQRGQAMALVTDPVLVEARHQVAAVQRQRFSRPAGPDHLFE